MNRITSLIGTLVLGLSLVACSESSAAEANKTPEQVKTEASEMDKTALEIKIEEYKTMIADLETEVKEKVGEGVDAMKEKGDDLIGAVGDAMKDGESTLSDEAKELKGRLAKLQANLAVYMDELAKK